MLIVPARLGLRNQGGWANIPYGINRQSIQARGLRGWWTALAQRNSRIFELVQGMNGTMVGNAAIQSDWFRGAVLALDGTGDYVNIGNPLPLRITSPFAISAWIYPIALPANNNNSYIVGKGFDSTSEIFFRFNGQGSEKFLQVGVYYAGTDYYAQYNATSLIPVNTWHHVLGQWTGTAYQIYIDGVQRVSTSETQGPVANTENWYIGCTFAFGSPDWYFNGRQDDVRIYSGSFTEAEVWQLWAPETRYELYLPKIWVVPSAPSGAIQISNAGDIPSAEAFGTPKISLSITGAGGITSAETHGTHQLNLNVTAAGNVASAEAHGTAKINLSLLPQAIASSEVFGTPKLNLNIATVGGIASAESFGEPLVAPDQAITAAGDITSQEAHGNPKLNLNITQAGGIVSGEACGPPQLNLNVSAAGNVASLEIFGTPTVSIGSAPQNISDAGGITSAESFGTALITIFVTGAGGVTSGEAFNAPKLNLIVTGAGAVVSAEIFGQPIVFVDQFITNAGDISSAEAFGTPVIQIGAVTIYPDGIATAEAFGSPKLFLNITAAGGIASAEAFGTVKINLNITSAGNIASAETFGIAKLGLVILAAGGIVTAETLGVPAISLRIYPAGIVSGEAFGDSYMLARAYPDADLFLYRWTDQDGGTANLYACIDEAVPSDIDYVKSDVTTTLSTLLVGLSNVNDPGVHERHIVRYRFRKYDTKGVNARLTVTLRMGPVNIAAWQHDNVGASWVDAEQTLTAEQAAEISDYTQLRLQFQVEEMV